MDAGDGAARGRECVRGVEMRITYSELQSLYRKRTGRDGNRNVDRKSVV